MELIHWFVDLTCSGPAPGRAAGALRYVDLRHHVPRDLRGDRLRGDAVPAGDSLLFGLGALAAIDTSGTLSPAWLALLLTLAAVLGNTVNYAIGKSIGAGVSGRYRFIKVDYLTQTERGSSATAR